MKDQEITEEFKEKFPALIALPNFNSHLNVLTNAELVNEAVLAFILSKVATAREEGKRETVDSFERWGMSRIRDYDGSELQGKVEAMKATLPPLTEPDA